MEANERYFEQVLALSAQAPEPAADSASNNGGGQSVPLAGLLDDLAVFVRRFVVLSEAQVVAVVLWIAHTWVFEAAHTTSYLHVTSAEPESGKTRLLEVLELLVCKPWTTDSTSTAALMRKVDADQPTALIDESDNAMKREKEYVAALLALLNSGYRRGRTATVCVGNGSKFEVRDFKTFCPKVVAGIGKLPRTLATRTIRIELKRRGPGESIEDFYYDEASEQATPLRDALAAALDLHVYALERARPERLAGLRDRQQEGWRLLFAIAELAGEGDEWRDRARRAALELANGREPEDESHGVRLLADIARLFDERDVDQLATETLLVGLNDDDEAQWATWGRGDKPLTATGLSTLLRPFKVRPKKLRAGEETFRGYRRGDFADACARYLPPQPGTPGTTT